MLFLFHLSARSLFYSPIAGRCTAALNSFQLARCCQPALPRACPFHLCDLPRLWRTPPTLLLLPPPLLMVVVVVPPLLLVVVPPSQRQAAALKALLALLMVLLPT
jgi:hypothetical protein